MLQLKPIVPLAQRLSVSPSFSTADMSMVVSEQQQKSGAALALVVAAVAGVAGYAVWRTLRKNRMEA